MKKERNGREKITGTGRRKQKQGKERRENDGGTEKRQGRKHGVEAEGTGGRWEERREGGGKVRRERVRREGEGV